MAWRGVAWRGLAWFGVAGQGVMILIVDGEDRQPISDTCLIMGILAALTKEQQALAMDTARQLQAKLPVMQAQASRVVRPG